MNPIRHLAEALADRIHATGDAQARAYGLTVERLPWGGRRIYDARVAVYCETRRRRILRDGPDPLDRLLMDAGTIAALRATAARMAAEQQTTRRRPGTRRAA
jgi:hypothetical protein